MGIISHFSDFFVINRLFSSLTDFFRHFPTFSSFPDFFVIYRLFRHFPTFSSFSRNFPKLTEFYPYKPTLHLITLNNIKFYLPLCRFASFFKMVTVMADWWILPAMDLADSNKSWTTLGVRVS